METKKRNINHSNETHLKIISAVKECLQNTTNCDIRIHTNKYIEQSSLRTIESINKTIIVLNETVERIKKLPKVGSVRTESTTYFYSVLGDAHNIKITYITQIIILPKPCKEWKTLVGKLYKYTRKTLEAHDCRTENLFGKRDNVDITSACYLSLSPEKCKLINHFLSQRVSKDTVTFEIKESLDDADRYNRNGEDMESEYYATRSYYIKLTIKTLTGRVKAENTFYV